MDCAPTYISVVKKRLNAHIPTRASLGSAGWDLYACIKEEIVLNSGCQKLIPSGVALSIPIGYTGLIFARSGLSVKRSISLSNCVGVIDSDYRGEIFVSLKNNGEKDFTVKSNDRIAQIVITTFCSFPMKEVLSLDNTKRSEGAFGSTGR
ncbi:MAG: dUTP diphosphatase [Oscillospiraceae bacterium]|jgi:dUTP pyrophosphatase|nr:dUTP diphosphatase [Oscillospiraceae bacterium]